MNNLDEIARHVAILNDEVGSIKSDMNALKIEIKWLKRILGYMAVIITGVFVAVVGTAIKYAFMGG